MLSHPRAVDTGCLEGHERVGEEAYGLARHLLARHGFKIY